MRLFKPIIVALSLCFFSAIFCLQIAAEDNLITLSEYTENYPKCLTHEVIYDGCSLMLNSDGEYLFVQFNILHPELQMRILMQGITFYVDPTGKKKEKYMIHFPAASSVENVMSQMAPPDPIEDMRDKILPDIKPLIAALAHVSVQFDMNRKSQLFEREWSSIDMDDSTHCLSYTFIIPVKQMLCEKKISHIWKLGLYSEGGRPANGGPGMDVGRNGPGLSGLGMGRPDMSHRRNERDNENSKSKVDLRKIMMNDIEVWIPFDFEEVCSLEQNNN